MQLTGIYLASINTEIYWYIYLLLQQICCLLRNKNTYTKLALLNKTSYSPQTKWLSPMHQYTDAYKQMDLTVIENVKYVQL